MYISLLFVLPPPSKHLLLLGNRINLYLVRYRLWIFRINEKMWKEEREDLLLCLREAGRWKGRCGRCLLPPFPSSSSSVVQLAGVHVSLWRCGQNSGLFKSKTKEGPEGMNGRMSETHVNFVHTAFPSA